MLLLASIVHDMTRSEAINYEVMAEDDDYDPRKPEYITPAKQDEMEHTSSELLGQQIARLEMILEKKQEDPVSPQSRKFQHYEQVLAEMRYEAGRGNRKTHIRMRSDPAQQADQRGPEASSNTRAFSHARIRSAPVPSFGCDIVPQDDKPLHINRVHGSTITQRPGEVLSEASRNWVFTSGLGAPVRASGACVPSKLVPNPARGTQRVFGRVPVGHPGDQARPPPCVSPTSPVKLQTISPLKGSQRKRPSTPPSAKTLGGRRIAQPLMCASGDLPDECINEFVVPSSVRPSIATRVPGISHILAL